MNPVFALDAQAGDLASLLVAVALVGASLLLAVRGSWWATAIPAAVAMIGLTAYATSESDPSWGGDSDPARLLGVVLVYIGGAWFVVALAIMLLARRLR